jgi:DNA-binding NarL/FixJ family response regulator
VAAPTQKLRVLIADDDAPTRASLRAGLEDGGISVCAEAATVTEAIDAALRTRPDVCLIDVRIPDGGGIAVIETIRKELPSAKVVLITAAPDEAGAVVAARAGADGYLDKDIGPQRLAQVVRAVAAGQAAYPRWLMHGMLWAIRQADPGERSET